MKVCSKCNTKKPFSEFSKRASSKDGYNVWCKPCKKTYDSEYFEKNREKTLQRNREYKAKDPKKWSEYGKAYYISNKEEMRSKNKEARMKAKYGVTHSDVKHILIEQDNKCAICNDDIAHRHVIDHNHATGEVRGLLCFNCNASLGGFKDSPDVLQSAVSYLNNKGFYGPKTTPSP